MVDVKEFYDYLQEKEIKYFAGVPDSQLKPFCDYITQELGVGEKHIITANEGNAVAMAAGYHLATGKVGMVYMQNSGLGNAVNPITSLSDPEVYGIPVFYLIGWRGQPGVKDEPQHVKQGKITLELLDLLDIKYQVVNTDTSIEDIKQNYHDVFQEALSQGKSVALVVAKNALTGTIGSQYDNTYELSREEAIKIIIDHQEPEDIIVSTTGKASRELFEYRETIGQGHDKDFLTVGSMGHASSIAAAIAENSNKNIWCIDGDGAMIMHTGALALIGSRKPKNLYHILINNGAHETVGGMPTVSFSLDWGKLMESVGYKKVYKVEDRSGLSNILKQIKKEEGPIFIEVNTNLISREDLGRPSIKPIDNKKSIMEFIQKS
jgi:phosphonopyruvate decarboxylase